MTRSWTDRVVRSRPNRLYLVRGKDRSGRAAWYYLRVTSPLALFEHALKTGTLNLTDHGEILKSGFGEDPPPNVVQEMKDEYGFKG